MYETRAEAEATQRKLEQLGIIDTDDNAVHDKDSPGFSHDAYSSRDDRGLWAGTKGAFLPDEDRHTYEEGIRRGHYLLTVNVDDEKAEQAHDILENSNAVNIDERASQWRQEGWTAPAAGAGMLGAAAATTGTDRTSYAATDATAMTGRGVTEERIPVVEEELRVGKRQVERGGVRVRSYVVEQPVHEQVSLRSEHVDVERRPVTGSTDTANLGDAFRERTVEVSETAEEAVVDKRAHVVEEVVVRKDVNERVEQIDDTVRRTEVDVDRLADNDRLGTDRLAARDADLDRTDRDGKLR
jgi:uncharacterized protein (TIGR02271 family)